MCWGPVVHETRQTREPVVSGSNSRTRPSPLRLETFYQVLYVQRVEEENPKKQRVALYRTLEGTGDMCCRVWPEDGSRTRVGVDPQESVDTDVAEALAHSVPKT